MAHAGRLHATACSTGNPALTMMPPKAEREVFAKYNHSHMQSYLEDNARVTFCPSAPWCGNAVQVRARARAREKAAGPRPAAT